MDNLTEKMVDFSKLELENDLKKLINDCVAHNPFCEPKNLTRICQVEKYMPEFSKMLQVKAESKEGFCSPEVRSWELIAHNVANSGTRK